MEIVTNRNACGRQLASLFFAFACVATFQPGCGKVQDIDRQRQAAELGDAEAQNKLGFMYARGEGVAEDDQEAAKWYRKAADQGYAKAQFSLGLSYAKGEGVQEDGQEAVKWELYSTLPAINLMLFPISPACPILSLESWARVELAMPVLRTLVAYRLPWTSFPLGVGACLLSSL